MPPPPLPDLPPGNNTGNFSLASRLAEIRGVISEIFNATDICIYVAEFVIPGVDEIPACDRLRQCWVRKAKLITGLYREQPPALPAGSIPRRTSCETGRLFRWDIFATCPCRQGQDHFVSDFCTLQRCLAMRGSRRRIRDWDNSRFINGVERVSANREENVPRTLKISQTGPTFILNSVLRYGSPCLLLGMSHCMPFPSDVACPGVRRLSELFACIFLDKPEYLSLVSMQSKKAFSAKNINIKQNLTWNSLKNRVLDCNRSIATSSKTFRHFPAFVNRVPPLMTPEPFSNCS